VSRQEDARAGPGAGEGAELSLLAPADPLVPLFEVLPAFEEDRLARLEPGPIARVMLDEASAPGRQLRLLADRMLALGRDKRLRRIGVAGSSAGEGSSTVALGLASALSRDPKLRVLLLELDLRHPTLDRELGLEPPEVGVREYLAAASDVPVLRRSPSLGFWLLSAGGESARKGPTLASPRLATLWRAADRVFDYVVADCPPVPAGREGAAVQGGLDGIVFVVRARHAPRETIRRAALQLRPERLVGLVLNGQRDLLFRGSP
jgi:Mrp family chromosome partitioning ATPase